MTFDVFPNKGNMLGTPNNIASKATLVALRTLHLAGVLHNSFCPYFSLLTDAEVTYFVKYKEQISQ